MGNILCCLDDFLFHDPSIFTNDKLDKIISANRNNNTVKTKSFTIESNFASISVMEVRPTNYKSNKLIIFSQGIGNNIYDSLSCLTWLSKTFGTIVVSYDYPGRGLTDGKMSEQSCYNVLNAIIENYNAYKNNIILIGYSFGTSVTIDYVSKHEWNNPVILIAPFKSISRVLLDNWFLDTFYSRCSTIDKIIKTTCPIKIIHGTNDTLVNIQHSIDLYELLPNKILEPYYVDGMNHGNIIKCIVDDYDVREILSFCL
jgi:hypothetical protein